jgi:hypothetical protein
MARGSAQGSLGVRNPQARVKSIIRGAQVSKVIFTVIIGLATAFTFSQYFAARTPETLVSGVTFSLAITLAYLVLYSLQVMPSFSGGLPYAFLSTLPVDKNGLSLITLFSVIRTFDTVALVAVGAQVTMVAFLTSSVFATVAILLAALANSVFGIAISVWLSGVFQRNISRGGRGTGAAVARFVFLVSWGLAAASLGFLFNLITYAIPVLDSAISGALSSTGIPILISLVHPFSAGLVVASIVFPSFSSISGALGLASFLSFLSLAAYILLAVVAAKKTLEAVNRVAMGQPANIVRQKATDFLLKLRRPIPAYVVKDVRVSSKSPSTAFIYALPVLETLIIVLTIPGGSSLHAYSILTATGLGCLFTLISASILLNTEGTGLDYTMSLPLNARVMVLAKSTISTVAYLPVPAAVGMLLIVERPAVLWLGVIPLIELAAVSAATSAELSFFIQSYKRSGGRHTSRGIETRGLNLMSAGDLVRLAGALVVAGLMAIGPLMAYAVAYFVSLSHTLAIGFLGVVAIAEFIGVQFLLRRT